jgi:HAD superfamily hydrolase (TIGR01509 family)
MRPAAVVFDLDGVLIESEEVWDEVRRGMATAHGAAWPADATRAMQGMSTPEWAAYLVGTIGVGGTPEQVSAEVIRQVRERYAERVPLLPGAVDTVRRIAAGGWPLGVASSSPRTLIPVVLAEAGIADLFRAVVSSEEVERGKPAPDVYLAAAERLSVPAEQTVAVEDSANGLRSAHAAGMAVVAVPNASFPPPADALDLAAVTLAGITELTPDVIAGLAR